MVASRKNVVVSEEGSLVEAIYSALRESEDDIPLGTIDPAGKRRLLYASQIGRLCAREEVLAARGGVTRKRGGDSALGLSAKRGSGMHWSLQNEVLAPWLLGAWRCRGCGKVAGPEIRRPDGCGCGYSPADHRSAFEYEERRVVDVQLGISGRMDGVLVPLRGESEGLGVLEIKSVSERRAKEVEKTPDVSHVLQVQAYMLVTGLRWGVLLYWNASKFKDPLFEYVLEADEELHAELRALLTGLWAAIEDRDLDLPERVCAGPCCTRAEECQLRKQCFAGYVEEVDLPF